MPTAIFLAQAVTDSGYPSPPLPGPLFRGKQTVVALAHGFGLQWSYSCYLCRCAWEKKRQGSREKSIYVVGAISRKVCGSSCTFTPCDRLDGTTGESCPLSTCRKPLVATPVKPGVYSHSKLTKGQDALSRGAFGRVRGSLCETKPNNHPHPPKKTPNKPAF